MATVQGPRIADTVIGFNFRESQVRGRLVRLERGYEALGRTHDYPLGVRKALGEAAASGLLLVSTLKFSGQLSLQLQGEGAISLLLLQCDEQLRYRGFARFRNLPVSGPRFGGDARLAITLDPNDGHNRYQGIVAADPDSLVNSVATYFQQSEQLGTQLFMGVDDTAAAGILLQQMPQAAEDDDDWHRTVLQAMTVTTDEMVRLPPLELLHRLFPEDDLHVFECGPAAMRCKCSRLRIERLLIAMGEQEIRDLLAEQGRVSVRCEFCGARYDFDAVDAMAILSGRGNSPSREH